MSNFVKGIIIGIAKILPGVSGSVIAISLDVYHRCIEILNNFYKMTKNDLKFIFPIFLGIIVGILGFCICLKSVYDNFYFPIMLLFIILIVKESYKDITVNLKRDILFYIIFIILYFALQKFSFFELNFQNKYILYGFIACVEAFTMIIPGISGSAILISLGLYEVYLTFISSLININYLINNLDIVLVYSVFLLISSFITIKLVYKLYEKNKCFNSIIRVLMFFSIMAMIKSIF